MNNWRMRLISNVVIAYMLIAFAWWSILLFVKNRDAFHAKAEYLEIVMVADGTIKSQEGFYNSKEYEELARKYRRQEWMIFGEATVFVISLIIGIWLINRGYRKAMFAAQQRRNFLLSITHELKSPIASIRLSFETFLRRNLDKQKINTLSQNGIDEADRLNDLVNNLLLAAKVETAYQPTMEALNLQRQCAEVVERLGKKYPKASIHFFNKLKPGEFSGDQFGVNALLINLIENAIKYSPDPATIELLLERRQEQIVLEVRDQGYGIPEEERKRIFDKFYRIGNEDTRRSKGTGLGLYIVQQIVKAHEGKINVLGNSPQGTIFQIFFPGKRFSTITSSKVNLEV